MKTTFIVPFICQENHDKLEFITADCRADFSNDGYGCYFGTGIPSWATPKGERLDDNTSLSQTYEIIVIQPFHSLTIVIHDFGPVLYQSVLGALVIVNLKGMLMQVKETPYLWKRDRPDCVSVHITHLWSHDNHSCRSSLKHEQLKGF